MNDQSSTGMMMMQPPPLTMISAGVAVIPTGVAVVGVARSALVHLSLADAGCAEQAWVDLVASMGGVEIGRDDCMAKLWTARVVAGDPKIPMEWHGTRFQKSVWQVVMGIPKGAKMTYGEIARRIGRPDACRAVGTAVGRNRIAIAVPCHRVVPAHGGNGNYRWGKSIKDKLLAQEATVASDR